jgi:hypothetical protein
MEGLGLLGVKCIMLLKFSIGQLNSNIGVSA